MASKTAEPKCLAILSEESIFNLPSLRYGELKILSKILN